GGPVTSRSVERMIRSPRLAASKLPRQVYTVLLRHRLLLQPHGCARIATGIVPRDTRRDQEGDAEADQGDDPERESGERVGVVAFGRGGKQDGPGERGAQRGAEIRDASGQSRDLALAL